MRYLEELPETTIDEAALAASCLVALPGICQADAAHALRAVAEGATSSSADGLRPCRGRGGAHAQRWNRQSICESSTMYPSSLPSSGSLAGLKSGHSRASSTALPTIDR